MKKKVTVNTEKFSDKPEEEKTVQDYVEQMQKEYFQVQAEAVRKTFEVIQERYPRLTLYEVYKLSVNVFQTCTATGQSPQKVTESIFKHFE